MGRERFFNAAGTEVWCNTCQAYIQTTQLRLIDGYHYHKLHEITAEPDTLRPFADKEYWDTRCNEMNGIHWCAKEKGHYPETQHECFMYPGACELKGW